jgi:hypothetical protein
MAQFLMSTSQKGKMTKMKVGGGGQWLFKPPGGHFSQNSILPAAMGGGATMPTCLFVYLWLEAPINKVLS